MSAERSAWLVVVFVAVLVLTVQILKRRYDALLLGTAFLPFLGAGLGVWAVAACRLGEPDSVWARWTYRDAKADRAFDRWYLAPDMPGTLEDGMFFRRLVDTVPQLLGGRARRDDVPPEPRPEPTADATRAVWLLVLATALAAVAGSAVLLVAGLLLPNAVLRRAGRPSAARVVDVLAVAGAVAEVVRLLASGPGLAGTVVSVASLAALIGGLSLLRRGSMPAVTAQRP